MSEAATGALLRLLEAERAEILAGRFDSLDDLTRRKLQHLGELPRWTVGRARLRAIAAQLQRNQALLDAAIGGARAARSRLLTVAGKAGTLTTYSSDGRRSEITAPGGALRKKA